jgi:3-oxoadipate enol-lactonase
MVDNQDRNVSKIQVADIEVAYKLEGNSNNPVVLMSNSLMSNMSMRAKTAPALLDKYQILRYDTRGHVRRGDQAARRRAGNGS